MNVPTLTFTTTAGTAEWPYLHKPTLNFNEDGEEYRTNLVLTADAAAPLLEKLEQLWDANLQFQKEQAGPKNAKKVKSSQHRPWEAETDEDGNETGNVVFKFKRPATVKRKADGKEFSFNVKLFDASGMPCPGAPVGGGSIIKVNAEARGYYVASNGAGIKLQCLAVQVINLVENQNGPVTAEAHGFGAEDDGFVAAADGETGGDF